MDDKKIQYFILVQKRKKPLQNKETAPGYITSPALNLDLITPIFQKHPQKYNTLAKLQNCLVMTWLPKRPKKQNPAHTTKMLLIQDWLFRL